MLAPARFYALCLIVGAACSRLDYQQCVEHVCPAELACCGSTCIATTCGDGTLDPGETCDTWTTESCVDANADFGQVACTATCQRSTASCTRFGFVDHADSCLADPVELVAIRGASTWISSTATEVARIRDGVCQAFALTARLLSIVPLSDDAVLLIARPQTATFTWSLWLLDPSGLHALPPLVIAGATVLGEPLVVDDGTVLLGTTQGIALIKREADGTWTTGRVQTICSGNALRRIQVMMPFGDELLTVFAPTSSPPPAPPGPVYAVISLDKVVKRQSQSPVCAAIPNAPADDTLLYRSARPSPTGYFLVGMGRVPVVLELAKAAGMPPTVNDLGLEASSVSPLDTVAATWLTNDELAVASATDVVRYRNQQWRRVDLPSRDFTAVASDGHGGVAATPTGLDADTGWGYEIVHDFRAVPPGPCNPSTCTVVASGLANFELALAARPSGNVLYVHGVPFFRNLESVVWDPRRLALQGRVPWVGARSNDRRKAYLFRGHGEGGAAPVPLEADACDHEIVALDTNASQAFVAVRHGTNGDATCPVSYAVFSRSSEGGAPAMRWTTSERVIAIATPTAGGDGALVAIARGDGFALVRIDAAGANEVAALATQGEMVGLWAETLDAGWVVGQGPSLVRFAAGALSDASTQLGSDGATPLAAIAGTHAGDVFVGGSEGLLVHYDGVAWARVRRPQTSQKITWLGATLDEIRIAMGPRDLALRAPRTVPQAPVCE